MGNPNAVNYVLTDEMSDLVIRTTLESKYQMNGMNMSLDALSGLLAQTVQDDMTQTADEKFEIAVKLSILLSHTSVLFCTNPLFDFIAFLRCVDEHIKEITKDEGRVLLQAIFQCDDITLSQVIDGGHCPEGIDTLQAMMTTQAFCLHTYLFMLVYPSRLTTYLI